MLYKLEASKDPFELNPGIRAIEAYTRLTDRQFFFVSLVADSDFDNPLKTLPEKIKREKAAKIAGYGMEGNRPDKNARDLINKNVERVEEAIEWYRSLQYDDDKVNLEIINSQIERTQALIRDYDKDKKLTPDKLDERFDYATKAIKLSLELTKLIKEKKELMVLIQRKDPIKIAVNTYTAADIAPSADEPPEDDGDEPMSTLDKMMAQQPQQ